MDREELLRSILLDPNTSLDDYEDSLNQLMEFKQLEDTLNAAFAPPSQDSFADPLQAEIYNQNVAPLQQAAQQQFQENQNKALQTAADLTAKFNQRLTGETPIDGTPGALSQGGGVRATGLNPQFVTQPTRNVLSEVTGQSSQDFVRQALSQYQNNFDAIRSQRDEALAEAERFRTGEAKVEPSNLAGNIVIVNNADESRLAIADGKIPIPAKDAQVILDAADREARMLRQQAARDVQIARANSRGLATQQAAQGVGTALASAIAGRGVDTSNLNDIRSRAFDAREAFLRSLERENKAQVDAGRLNSRAKIDAMIANLEPIEAVKDILFQDRLDTQKRQFQREDEARQRALQLEDRLIQAQANRPQVISNLVNVAGRLSAVPVPGKVVTQGVSANKRAEQVNATRASLFEQANQISSSLSNIKENFDKSQGQPFKNVDEESRNAELNQMLQNVQRFNQTIELARKGSAGPLPQDVEQLIAKVNASVDPLITRLSEAGVIGSEGVNIDEADSNIFGTSAFEIVEEEAQNLDIIKNHLGGNTTSPSARRTNIDLSRLK